MRHSRASEARAPAQLLAGRDPEARGPCTVSGRQEHTGLMCISLVLLVKALCSPLHPGIFPIFPTLLPVSVPYITAHGHCVATLPSLWPQSVKSAILTTDCLSQLPNPAVGHHRREEGGRSRSHQHPPPWGHSPSAEHGGIQGPPPTPVTGYRMDIFHSEEGTTPKDHRVNPSTWPPAAKGYTQPLWPLDSSQKQEFTPLLWLLSFS